MMRIATISILIAVTLLTVVAIAEAQQPAKIPRIGILRIGAPPDPLIESFRSELNRLGYVDRQNIIIEARYSQDNQAQLRDLVADLVRQKFDVIIAPGGTAARAAKDATSTIPIVITAVADPV